MKLAALKIVQRMRHAVTKLAAKIRRERRCQSRTIRRNLKHQQTEARLIVLDWQRA